MSELRDSIENILDKAADWEWAVANEVCAGDGLNRDEATDAIMSLIKSERAEKEALAQKCDDWKYEAYQNGSALWRVMPNLHTIHVPGINEPGDPFEGPGETYEAAYARVMAEKEALREAAKAVLRAVDSAKMVETGAGGMTIESQLMRSVYQRVPALPFEWLRAALGDT